MYDPIFAKSFSRYDRRRFGCFGLIFSLIIALTICSTFKPTLHPLTLIGDAVSLQLSINAVESMLIDDAVIINSAQTVSDAAAHNMLVINETATTSAAEPEAELLNPQNMLVINETATISAAEPETEAILNPQNMLMINESERNRLQIDQNMQNVSLQNMLVVVNESERNHSQIDQRRQNAEPLVDKPEINSLQIDQNLQNVEPLSLQNMLMINESEINHSQIDQQRQNANIQNMLMINESERNRPQIDQTMQNVEPLDNKSESNRPQIDQRQNVEPLIIESERNHLQIDQKQNMEPLCRTLQANADYCEIEGDVRIDPNSSTVFLIRPRSTILSTNTTTSWIIQPYPRRGTGFVKNWTVKLAAADDGDTSVPKCSQIHSQPALLFSIGGFTGNHFHDFADILVPLFTTSFHFKTEVQFLAADYKPWWPAKYRPLLSHLTRHVILDIHREKTAHCYRNLIAGLKFHRELVIDPSSGVSMHRFRQLLRRTYSLDRNKAIQYTKSDGRRPRLMIVSRKRTRILTNEDQISRSARKLGFEVVSAEGEASANLTKFAQVVNSCDVMMGVHGAGLTNMVFLPDKAVLIQIVPLGAIGIFAKLDFGNPSAGMNLRYLEYGIEMKESSLIQRYGMEDPVLRDPISVHRQGWGKLREVYLNNQNVTIDVRRFRATLANALKLLRR